MVRTVCNVDMYVRHCSRHTHVYKYRHTLHLYSESFECACSCLPVCAGDFFCFGMPVRRWAVVEGSPESGIYTCVGWEGVEKETRGA